MNPHYHVNIFWHAPDECWVADVPDLKACSAFGDTPEQALQEVQIAMAGWLDTAAAHGMTIPQPAYRPEEVAQRFAA